jgi:hypothetical protein
MLGFVNLRVSLLYIALSYIFQNADGAPEPVSCLQPRTARRAKRVKMGLAHTIPKIIMTLGCLSAPIMLAAGLGLIEDAPAPLIKANGGMGADKALWGAEFLGTTRANVLILLGVCKAATLLDIWVLHIVPQLACLCYAVMMGLVFHCHQAMGDDLPPPVVIGTMALITMVTWPAAKKANGKKRTQ